MLTVGEGRSNWLASLRIHMDIPINIGNIILRFTEQINTRFYYNKLTVLLPFIYV